MFSSHFSLTGGVGRYFFLSIHYDRSQNACTTEESIVCLWGISHTYVESVVAVSADFVSWKPRIRNALSGLGAIFLY
jgi:hypothetical protein